MQWDASPSGGFSTGAPWLPLVDPGVVNVADQSVDPASLLTLYRRLLRARAEPALRRGTHRSVFGLAEGVLAWLREHDGQRVLVLCNLSDEARTLDSAPLRRFGLPDAGDVLVATSDRAGRVELRSLQLEPLEGLALSV
jgi:glycosidase